MAGEGIYTSRASTVDLVIGTLPVIPADPMRVGVEFTFNGGFGGATLNTLCLGGGVYSVQVASAATLRYLYHDWGPIVGQAWTYTATAMGGTISVLELLLNRRD